MDMVFTRRALSSVETSRPTRWCYVKKPAMYSSRSLSNEKDHGPRNMVDPTERDFRQIRPSLESLRLV